ncbi:MAG: hypothetical protein HY291_00475 [Planctomycetes bacterium]|nr:hypothetical protein [Planctomycetota bacterium]
MRTQHAGKKPNAFVPSFLRNFHAHGPSMAHLGQDRELPLQFRPRFRHFQTKALEQIAAREERIGADIFRNREHLAFKRSQLQRLWRKGGLFSG